MTMEYWWNNIDGKHELPVVKPAQVPLCPSHTQPGLTDWPRTEPGPLRGQGGNWRHEPWPDTKISILNDAAKGYQPMVHTLCILVQMWVTSNIRYKLRPKHSVLCHSSSERNKVATDTWPAAGADGCFSFHVNQPTNQPTGSDGRHNECLWSRIKRNSELQQSASPSYKSWSTIRVSGGVRSYTDLQLI